MKVDVPVMRCTVCDAPYVLRFSLRMTAPAEWMYQRDCKHKTGLPTGTVDAAEVETAPLVVPTPLAGALLEHEPRGDSPAATEKT